MFGQNKKQEKKIVRFQRPEFQEKLARARKFQRKAEPVPEKFSTVFLQKLGLGSLIAKFLLAVIILSVFFFLTISHEFLVSVVLAEGNDLDTQQVEKALKSLQSQRIYLVQKNHILMLNKKNLLSALQKYSPEIKEITYFKKSFPNKLTISLKKREATFIWGTGQNYYYADQDGYAFQMIENHQISSSTKPLIIDRSENQIALGEEIKNPKLLDFVRNATVLWPKIITYMEIANFGTPNILSSEIDVKTKIGFTVYFNSLRNAKIQLQNLAIILDKEIKPETYSGLSYIDLRLSNIGYYCFLDAPCAPENTTSTAPTDQ